MTDSAQDASCDQDSRPHQHYPCCEHCATVWSQQCMFDDLHHDPCSKCQ